MCMIFGKGGEGDGLLMRAPLRHSFFEILKLKNPKKCVNMFEIGRRPYH